MSEHLAAHRSGHAQAGEVAGGASESKAARFAAAQAQARLSAESAAGEGLDCR